MACPRTGGRKSSRDPPGPIEAASVGAVVDAVKKEPRAEIFLDGRRSVGTFVTVRQHFGKVHGPPWAKGVLQVLEVSGCRKALPLGFKLKHGAGEWRVVGGIVVSRLSVVLF